MFQREPNTGVDTNCDRRRTAKLLVVSSTSITNCFDAGTTSTDRGRAGRITRALRRLFFDHYTVARKKVFGGMTCVCVRFEDWVQRRCALGEVEQARRRPPARPSERSHPTLEGSDESYPVTLGATARAPGSKGRRDAPWPTAVRKRHPPKAGYLTPCPRCAARGEVGVTPLLGAPHCGRAPYNAGSTISFPPIFVPFSFCSQTHPQGPGISCP